MKPTEAQLAEYKANSKQWAQERLADQSTVIIDIESTGLLNQDPTTEIVQLCILNIQGRPLFSMMLKPVQPMKQEVIDIHKITNEQIANQPTFPQVAKDKYSEWAGEWSAKKEGFKWQKLPNFIGEESHDAISDCKNALKAMQKMAGLFNEENLTASDISLDF